MTRVETMEVDLEPNTKMVHLVLLRDGREVERFPFTAPDARQLALALNSVATKADELHA